MDTKGANEVEAEKAWRKHYPRYFRRLEAAGLASDESAVRIAAHGVDAFYREMVFEREGETLSVDELPEV